MLMCISLKFIGNINYQNKTIELDKKALLEITFTINTKY